ncbi:DNA cytosine methyltransferase [Lentzea sp. NPDC102401]|uniref:DNA cytosine methyltransferase n=1 Tax=Lentzea sp. NPDC102401 TaxID=3364128 RepID=UPI0038163A97
MLTIADHFAGAGGSSQGFESIDWVSLALAINHWDVAVRSHALNFPNADHAITNLSVVPPRYFMRTDLAWFSPECTNHSVAKGKKRNSKADPTAVRSRATMWDVVRFTEAHLYEAIIVENVVDIMFWDEIDDWLRSMRNLGYTYQIVYANSMHFPSANTAAAPQSRDRCYVIFTKVGNKAPDLQLRPPAYCPSCDKVVAAMQVFKKRTSKWPCAQWGKYGLRNQYVYRCPNSTCRNAVVEPFTVAAETIIDWDTPGERIGDRANELKPATLARIQIGLDRFANPFVPFIAELRGGGSRKKVRPITDPFATMCASGRHHMLVRNNGTRGAKDGNMCSLVTEPARTITTRGHQSLVGWEGPAPAIEDCTYRMLTVDEIRAAMAFRAGYLLEGTQTDKIKQLGNAVTPLSAEFFVGRVAESLGYPPVEYPDDYGLAA